MRGRSVLIAPFLVSCAIALGQQSPAQPAFLAADIHEHVASTNRFSSGGSLRRDRYELQNVSLLDLIFIAWEPNGENMIGKPYWLTNDRLDKVVGGPEWLDADHYDVVAKAPAGSDKDALKAMLRSLLAERFALKAHKDQRPVQAFVLTAGAKPRLKQSAEGVNGACTPQPPKQNSETFRAAAYTCRGVTMAAFAEGLWKMADDHLATPVLNKTGIEGTWDFDITWTPRTWIAGAGSNGILLSEALDKQLGLKLETHQIDMPVIAVDHVDRKPTANAPGIESKLPALPRNFEVATLKPTSPDQNMRRFQTLPGGRVEIQGFPLGFLISQAWDIPPDMLADAPKWLASDRYDITAKAPEEFADSRLTLDIEELRPMLRALLTERFGMKTHREMRDAPVYALVRGKTEPKLRKAEGTGLAECIQPSAASSSAAPKSMLTAVWACRNITMALFALRIRDMAPAYIDHFTVDGTGMTGAWDFDLAWTPVGGGAARPEPGAPSEPDGSMTVFEALDKQLNLKLENQKRPAPVLVIDHIDQKPTEN